MPSAEHEVTDDLSVEELEARMAALTQPAPEIERSHESEAARLTAQLADQAESGMSPYSRGVNPLIKDSAILDHYGIDMTAARAVDAEDTHVGVPVSEYRMFDPLPNAADEYITFAQNPQDRIYLGIPEFDAVMRGIAPSELCLVVGFAHSGKTLLTAEVILNNRDKRIIFFTPDETRVLVLVKLCSLVHGISAEELEERIAVGDRQAIEMIRSTARDEFPYLAVFDQGVGLRDMDRAWDEVTHHWGAPPQLSIFDYAELLDGIEDVKQSINGLKAWGKNHHVPKLLLHQSSRTSGADGKAVTISSGGFGGEQQATFLIGVRRKKSEIMARIMDLKVRIATSTKDTSALEELKSEAEWELTQHQDTVTFNLVKNKRPPSRLVEELDFKIDDETGRIRQLRNGDLSRSIANRGESAATDARALVRAAAVQQQQNIYGDEEPF